MNKLQEIFSVEKPIIGMIHLAGEDPVKRALKELKIFEQEGINGAIIEDYHGSPDDVFRTLKASRNFNIVKGINILRYPYSTFALAHEFGAQFIQFDSVQTSDLTLTGLDEYNTLRKKYPNIAVLGGVGFKYKSPTGNSLEIDLEEAKPRCEAIVTTGEGTGMETPIEKLKQYKELLKEFPLVVGAGVTQNNVYEQLTIVDGAIIGSSFKPGQNTRLPIDRKKVHSLMEIVKQIK